MMGFFKAKACLKLSSWLRWDYPDLNLENIVLKMHADIKMVDVSLLASDTSFNKGNLSSRLSAGFIIEEIVGTATKLSTHLCPIMGKSWISYAYWCFDQARNALLTPHETVNRSYSFSPTLSPEIIPERFKLTEDEVARVESVIVQFCQNKGYVGEYN
ncbi:hypothetical protein WN944_029002 [Citrus x changshan-huyou]|uniref:Protein kinase domain-containing protein n=1 Tax=Citrus x changshan-huyou TaxID=2935761 RepID=A0AAP0LLK2_9ROSI